MKTFLQATGEMLRETWLIWLILIAIALVARYW